jgi:hypothetical protein
LAKGTAAKRPFLEKFLIHQMRYQDAQKHTVSERAFETHDEKIIEREWMSRSIMDQRVGPSKARKQRASGLIPSRPDSVTKSEEDSDVEWGVPKEIQRWTDNERNKTGVQAVTDATADDLALVGIDPGAHDPEAAADLPIKMEPAHKADDWADKIKLFDDTKTIILKNFQHKDLVMKQAHSKMKEDANPLMHDFTEAFRKHSVHLSTFLKTLEKIVTATTYDRGQLPKLFKLQSSLEQKL